MAKHLTSRLGSVFSKGADLDFLHRRPIGASEGSRPAFLELLEPRTLLSGTYLVVSTVSDAGPGSLRQAILDANASPGHDVIEFHIGSGGVQEISLLNALPAITDEVTLDGTSQAGYAGTPLVWLDGSGIADAANGLTVAAGNSLIRGLAITGFNQDGILIQGGGDSVQGNFIGVDPTGAAGLGNGLDGVEVSGIDGAAPASADVRNNVISGNGVMGISFSQNFAASNVVNNKIGVDASGSFALGNWGDGVYVGPSDVGMPGAAVRGNVISGNYGDGVRLDGAVNAVIAANRIGTDAGGSVSVDAAGGLLSNFGNGITIQGWASGNLIGGPDADDLNLISGNFGDGVGVLGGSGNTIQGNYVGTDLGGTEALGNYGNGIDVLASGNRIVGNVLSGNYGNGLRIQADANTVQGNRVGTQADGLGSLGNFSDGIWIDGTGNIVGGAEAGAGNVVAFNIGNGVTVNSGTGNAIRGNSIYADASGDAAYPGIGIDLGYDGVTLNDSLGHNGPNGYQNFPVLLSATGGGNAVAVQGTLTATPLRTFTVDFYSNAVADGSGYGQGQTFVGSKVVTTDASGVAPFSVTLNDVPDGQGILTATATDQAGNTSEFSAALKVEEGIGSSPIRTATALSSSANPSVFGQSVTFTAFVADLSSLAVPTGSVSFMEGTTLLGTSILDSSGYGFWSTSDLGAGTHNITAVYAGEFQFVPSVSDPLAQAVNPAVLTVTAGSASKTYGAANPVFTDAISGFVNGDTAAVVSGTPGLTSTATVGSAVGAYAITAGQGTLSAANYSFSYVSGTLTVTPAALTITANNQTKIYGQADPALTAQYSGFVNGDAAASLSVQPTLSVLNESGGVGTYVIQASGAADSNYSIAYVNGTLTVNPAVLTVTAGSASKTYGAANPAFTDTVTGFVNGDTAAVVSGTPSLTTTATAASPVGTYAITAGLGTLSAANYSFSYVSGTLTVNQAVSGITLASSANPSVNGQLVTFTATIVVVAPGSGTPVGSVSFMDGSTVLGSATVNNGTASLATSSLTLGSHTITAIYGGSANIAASTSAPLSQAVNPSPSSLNGYVYLDTNNDGVKQSTEVGVPGVKITLSGSNDLGGIAPVTVQTDATGYYAFGNLRPGTYTITETSPAGYIDGKEALGTQGGTVGNDVLGNISLAGGVNGNGYNFGELKNLISGRTLRDMSGNGMTSDDVALPGTTLNLYLDRDGNGVLGSADGAPVATAVSDASGSYAFVNLAPGQYLAREIVPSGYVRTIPYLSDYYTVDLTSTPGGAGYDFDNYKQCTGTITNVTYTINNCKTVTDLRSQTHQGDTVTVTFTVAGTASAYVTFVTYNAPSPVFDASIADEQTIDQQVGGLFNPGVHSLTVTIPNNYYQIDFVKCVAIDHLGPAGSNIFYSAQGRLISADNAGTHSDVDDMAASTAFWANLGQTLIRSFNVTADNLSPTALSTWLAQSFPNLYGSGGANNMTGKTNAQVAAVFTQMYKNTSQKTDAQVLATALNVYATTASLGGNAGTAYQFDVTDEGLGAAFFSVLSNGSAFGVANNTTLSVWQILQATNSKSKNDVLYNGAASMLTMAYSMYSQINTAGGIS